jgi:hypothetical protein
LLQFPRRIGWNENWPTLISPFGQFRKHGFVKLPEFRFLVVATIPGFVR